MSVCPFVQSYGVREVGYGVGRCPHGLIIGRRARLVSMKETINGQAIPL